MINHCLKKNLKISDHKSLISLKRIPIPYCKRKRTKVRLINMSLIIINDYFKEQALPEPISIS